MSKTIPLTDRQLRGLFKRFAADTHKPTPTELVTLWREELRDEQTRQDIDETRRARNIARAERGLAEALADLERSFGEWVRG